MNESKGKRQKLGLSPSFWLWQLCRCGRYKSLKREGGRRPGLREVEGFLSSPRRERTLRLRNETSIKARGGSMHFQITG